MADFIEGALAGQQFALNQFKLQEAPIQLEQDKMALALTKADFAKRQAMADMLAKAPQQPTDDQNPMTTATNALMRMAGTAVQVGLPEEGFKYLKEAGTLQAQQSEAAYKNWEIADQRAKFALPLLANVHDQASWEQMNTSIEMLTGQKSAMAEKKYSPELVAALKDATTKHVDQAKIDLTKAQTKKTEVDTQLEREKIPLVQAQARAADALAVQRAKAGDKDSVTPKPAMIAGIKDLMKSDSPDGTLSSEQLASSREIALDAQQRMSEEHLTQPEALNKAYLSAKKNGMIPAGATHHIKVGSLPKKPAPLPADASKLQDDNWYQTSKGVLRWDAGKQKFFENAAEEEADEEE